MLESGDSVTHSVPIYEGYVFPHAITGLNLAGRGITDHLMKILNEESGYCFNDGADYKIMRDVKEKLSYIALNYELELTTPKTKEKSYTLPDGELISHHSRCRVFPMP